MIDKRGINREIFLDEIKGHNLYCYGAGNAFHDFLLLYPEINVIAVIDERLYEEQSTITEQKIPVISLKEFVDQYDRNSVLLITCLNYRDVQNKLNDIKELDSLDCYIYSMLEKQYCDCRKRHKTNKYQIVEFRLQDFTAGQKAPADVVKIAEKEGYDPLMVCRGKFDDAGIVQSEAEWNTICKQIDENSTFLIQLPLCDQSDGIYEFIRVKREKNVKVIGVLHDIDIFRGFEEQRNQKQYELLRLLADILIVHNCQMVDLLVKRGFRKEMLIDLRIFDYLIEDEQIDIPSDGGIIIAGNLSAQKSAYINNINIIQNVNFNLFGINYKAEKIYSNIRYFGSFLPQDLIKHLQGSYGLVWDGDSLETCSGATGQYLKINNPHKLSLYLAVGVPVIIWDEAAEAEFVLREGVGITVGSLLELPKRLAEIDSKQYDKLKQNAKRIGFQLRNGEYLKNAIRLAEHKINIQK